MALYFSSDMMKVFRGTVFYDSLASLFQKVKTTLPPESKKFIKNVEQTLHLGITPYILLCRDSVQWTIMVCTLCVKNTEGASHENTFDFNTLGDLGSPPTFQEYRGQGGLRSCGQYRHEG